MRGTKDSGTGMMSRSRSICASRTSGIACDCDAVPAWIIAPVSAKRLVITPEKGAVIARTRELVSFARQQGYRRDELIRLIEELA